MLTFSIPKLLQEANEVKMAMEQIGEGLPSNISVSEMEGKISGLTGIIASLDKVNAERTQLINARNEMAKTVSDYIVFVRNSIKGNIGADSSEYEMVGGTRTSERKKRKTKPKETT
jgi:hypothetical protein